MSEFSRSDGGHGDGDAKIELVKTYRLEPGQAGLYDVRDIHAIDYPAQACFVRVTGRPLEDEPRLRFDMETGKADFIFKPFRKLTAFVNKVPSFLGLRPPMSR